MKSVKEVATESKILDKLKNYPKCTEMVQYEKLS